MTANVPSATLLGVEGHPIRVEVHVSNGLPCFTVVGLPDASCREARDRVRAAILSSRFEFPDRKVIVNLAPSNLRKIGSGLDLAIAVGLLSANKALPPDALVGLGFLGELGLDGTLRPVVGTLPLVDALGEVRPVVPVANLAEARLVRPDSRAVRTLRELVLALKAEEPWPDPPLRDSATADPSPEPDLSDVQGHVVARVALEVAAAGGHHLLMVGPPGAGKTMLAERLPGVLPDLSDRDAMDVSRIHSAAASLRAERGLVRRPPLRSPHHTASLVALVGGGTSQLRPGEVSLASGRVGLCSMSSRAAMYCRISRDPKGDMLGVQRQEKACRELCERNGWTLVEPVFVDDDRSAYSGKPRPGYTAMLESVRNHDLDVLVAWAPDRFTRSTRDLEELIDTVEAAGVDIATVQSGTYDLTTPSGRMSARVVGAVARYESEHKSARLRAKAAEIAATGRVGGGGTRPYGFEIDRKTIRPTEAKVIRAAAARVVAGESLRGVAKNLTARGIPTVTGSNWTTPVLRRLLCAPRTAGLREHRGQVVGKAEWKPILDETTWQQVRAILLDPSRTNSTSARKYLLTGYAFCALCGGKLVARPRADKMRCYVCASGPNFNGCGKIRIVSETLEDHVVAMIVEAIDGGALADALEVEMTEDDVEVTGEIARLESELDGLANDYAEGDISRDAYRKASARMEARLGAERQKLSAAAGTTQRAAVMTSDEPLVERWPQMSFDQRRVVVDAVIAKVVVGSAVRGRNFFDPNRVTVEWRA